MKEVIEKLQDLIDRAKDALANRTARYVLIAVVVVVLALLMVGKSYGGTVMIFDHPKSLTTQYLALDSEPCSNKAILDYVKFLQMQGAPPLPGEMKAGIGKYGGQNQAVCWVDMGSHVLVFWDDSAYTMISKSDFRSAI